ncbi:ATP-binding cassette domain-containing protein, partial [Enterococcus casseliflavus]
MLEAINISKRYDRSVLDGLSFAVQPGEIVGVVGKSGSGKSTLLRLLNLIETPDSGE